MRTPLFPLLVASCALLAGLPAGAQVGDPELAKYEIDEVFETIADDRDGVSRYWPYVLACRGHEDEFATFRKAMRLLKNPTLIQDSFLYVAHHDSHPSRDLALAFLEREALTAKRAMLRTSAATTITYFRNADPLLERILHRSKDDEVRAIVLRPILLGLSQRGDVGSLELILDVADPSDGSQIASIEHALRRYTSPEAIAVLKARIAHHQTPDNWRLILMSRLRTEPGGDVTELLMDLLRRRNPPLQLLALEIIEERGCAERVRKEILGFIESKDDSLCYAAIVTAGRTMAGDPRWTSRLFRLAEHRDRVRRAGAAAALAELRTPEAIELLYSMFGDEDWRVRIAVIRAAASLRRKDSIPLFLEALASETGRVHWELVNTLEQLTGLRLGRSSATWKRWWDTEGEAFTLPAARAVEAKLAALDERLGEMRTVASFYGIPVLSDRVCFVLDTSGSMSEPAVVEGRTRTVGGGPTRLDIAKEQLRSMLDALSTDRRCNIVFFASDVLSWQDEVVPLDERAREDAARFVDHQRAGGATNLYDALELAFADELVDTIYLLSDGVPTSGAVVGTEAIRRAVRQINAYREIQIHCIAIGDDSELLRLLAEDSRGEYRNVGKPPEPEDEEE